MSVQPLRMQITRENVSDEVANDASISEQLGNCVCNQRLQRASCTVAAIHCETWRRRSSVTIHENDDKQPRHRFLAIAAEKSTLIGETPACNCANTYIHTCVCICVCVCVCVCERESEGARSTCTHWLALHARDSAGREKRQEIFRGQQGEI
jgi:hypothetical protein